MPDDDKSVSSNTRQKGPPTVTGLSPTEGTPGTQITIRGENLGIDQNDILMLFICGTDCLHTAKFNLSSNILQYHDTIFHYIFRWKTDKKIVARLGQANRGLGDVKIATKSGGRGVCNVKFRVFIAQVGPLEESAVWVDESQTVPGREAVRTVAQTTEERDALGLKPTSKKMDSSTLSKMFPEGSGNIRMESFSPQWYLLEHHSETSIEQLREALKFMQLTKADEAKKNEQMHKSYSSLWASYFSIYSGPHSQFSFSSTVNILFFPYIYTQITEARVKAESVFKDVLSRKDRADATRNALSVLTRFKFIFFLSKTIDENMKKGEYLTILNDYMRAKSLYKDTEVSLFKELMIHLDEKMELFKEEMKMKLIDTSASFEEQSKLIKYLKVCFIILEPGSDPTWECITAYHCWLEDILWKLQQDHFKKALEVEGTSLDGRFLLVETNERQLFVSSLVSILMNKLQSFWKLSNTYTTNDERWTQRQEDINQMLINTINVSSWLILNALVPKALPDDVIKRYEEQFVKWPEVSPQVNRIVLIQGLKTLRSFISALLEAQFTSVHVQPLVELCMTVRLKVISDIIDKGVENICALGSKENWRQEFSSNAIAKTALPDFYENEIFDCLSAMRDALSTSNYPGEACLFSRDRFRATLVDIFVHLIVAIRHCLDRLLHLRADLKTPMNFDLPRKDDEKSFLTTKKLLISICNLEYISETALHNITRRMLDCGIKYVDEIHEKSRTKLSMYRQTLIRCYIMIKSSAFSSLIDSVNYEYIPDNDVSDYAKEMMMCCVLQQAELELCSPQLTLECLQATVQAAFDYLLDHLEAREPSSKREVDQRVIDICALEQALESSFRTHVNSYRAGLVGQLDQRKLQRCLSNMRGSMRMAIDSLEGGAEDSLNTSSI
ncbi:IPT/TIG domain protein [Dictyocaulus viviparus]|uniref:Exocyst complex component 2 n=1 Tax=Dictyocaulus viviparus TaxID=29172 RepID=A0A0D8XPT3_DICVI|nr:IPT/TIG domain protein [Dictyocaulus viviparus]